MPLCREEREGKETERCSEEVTAGQQLTNLAGGEKDGREWDILQFGKGKKILKYGGDPQTQDSEIP